MINPFSRGNDLSESEKLDMVYKFVRAQRRAMIVKRIIVVILLCIAGYLYYMIAIKGDKTLEDKITGFAEDRITAIVMPITQSMIKNIMAGGMGGMNIPTATGPHKNTTGGTKGTDTSAPADGSVDMSSLPKLTPEQIKAAQAILNAQSKQ